MFYGEWHTLFQTTFLDRKVFDYYDRMLKLLHKTPTARSLVHGGYGYGNVLVDSTEVTVVLDWTDARFGDPLFDLAYMDFWPSGYDLVDPYQRFCEERDITYEHYRERVQCYKYYSGLDAMRFFAKTENKNAHNSVIAILDGLPMDIM